MEVLRTELQERRRRRDMAIYSEYEQMMSVPGQSSTEVAKLLMRKYDINSIGTIYVIRKRVEKRLQEEGRR
jgi:hypothetical protein